MSRASLAILLALVLAGCQGWPPKERPLSEGHINNRLPPVTASRDDSIPAPVSSAAFVPAPAPEAPTETYTVVVNNVPVNELLFALARDASLNIDVHPEVRGDITLNAIDQTLTQILDRIGRQLPVRYEERNSTLSVLPDSPFLRMYQLDYVNLTRESSSAVETSANVGSLGGDVVGGGGSGGGSDNRSDQSISGTSNNRLWETVEANITAIVSGGAQTDSKTNNDVMLSREVGLITVRATSLQHEQIEEYLVRVRRNANRQVLIEATIVEVNLSDRFQAGIDWSFVSQTASNTFQLGTSLTGGFDAAAGGAVQGLLLSGERIRGDSTSNFAAKLLSEFGDVSVLSSPKIIALNNQPAVLKVVDNEVYFNISVEVEDGEDGDDDELTIDTEIRTVPIGIVMTVTPQIDRNGMVIMNVRPTITRVRNFKDNPGIELLAARQNLVIDSGVPIVQVRETETVLRVGSRQTAVIGGLMQDRSETDDESIPGLADLPTIGNIFNNRDRQQTKTELVVFLRPTVITDPDVDGDFSTFRRYLPENLSRARRLPTPLEFDPERDGSGGGQPE